MPTTEAAQDALQKTAPDGTILDVHPEAKVAFSLADALLARGPWQTGYDAQVMPSRFVHVKRCEKPIAAERIAAALFG